MNYIRDLTFISLCILNKCRRSEGNFIMYSNHTKIKIWEPQHLSIHFRIQQICFSLTNTSQEKNSNIAMIFLLIAEYKYFCYYLSIYIEYINRNISQNIDIYTC